MVGLVVKSWFHFFDIWIDEANDANVASQKSLEREIKSFSVLFCSDKAFIVDRALFFLLSNIPHFTPLKGFTDNFALWFWGKR